MPKEGERKNRRRRRPPAASCKYRTHNATMDWRTRTRNGKWLLYTQSTATIAWMIGCVEEIRITEPQARIRHRHSTLSRSLQSRIAVFDTQDGSPDKKRMAGWSGSGTKPNQPLSLSTMEHEHVRKVREMRGGFCASLSCLGSADFKRGGLCMHAS